MHYKNGREAKNGDKIVLLTHQPAVGILFDAQAGAGSDCNGSIAPLTGGYIQCADLKNCLHIEDIAAAGANIPDTSNPKPVSSIGKTENQQTQ